MRNSSNCLSEVFFALCKSIDSARSLAAWILFREGEFLQLVGLKIRPDDYDNSDAFAADYLITEYLSKYKGFEVVDTEAEALKRFSASEELCRKNNRRILDGAPLPSGADALILRATRKIHRLLGDFSYSKVIAGCRWGPGATSSIAARNATVDNKILERELCVTLHALPYFKAVFSDDIHWLRARGFGEVDGPTCALSKEFRVVGGGKLSVVPKNAKTGRTILVEPTCNLFLQFGVGHYIRRQLLKVGIDLNSQDRNRFLAKSGYATIDMKAASDTVYRELVYQLLPFDWALYLDRIRSKSYTLDGKVYRNLEKFSSMGNGFTFELESLLFWAIARSAMDNSDECGAISVFGDDIVVPVGSGKTVVTALEALGFEVNPDKTFLQGCFRESCGGHYWLSEDVTPIYQKEVPQTHQEVIRLFNRLVRLSLRWGARLNGGLSCRDSRLRNAARAALRFCGPSVEAQPELDRGDDGFLVFQDDPPWLLKAVNRRFVQLPKRRRASPEALLAYTLRFGPFTGSQDRKGVMDWVFTLPFYEHVSVRSGGAYVSKRRPYPGYLSDAPWT